VSWTHFCSCGWRDNQVRDSDIAHATQCYFKFPFPVCVCPQSWNEGYYLVENNVSEQSLVDYASGKSFRHAAWCIYQETWEDTIFFSERRNLVFLAHVNKERWVRDGHAIFPQKKKRWSCHQLKSVTDKKSAIQARLSKSSTMTYTDSNRGAETPLWIENWWVFPSSPIYYM
jgi:hypothetical protein